MLAKQDATLDGAKHLDILHYADISKKKLVGQNLLVHFGIACTPLHHRSYRTIINISIHISFVWHLMTRRFSSPIVCVWGGGGSAQWMILAKDPRTI